jgi:hypothetical protein
LSGARPVVSGRVPIGSYWNSRLLVALRSLVHHFRSEMSVFPMLPGREVRPGGAK